MDSSPDRISRRIWLKGWLKLAISTLLIRVDWVGWTKSNRKRIESGEEHWTIGNLESIKRGAARKKTTRFPFGQKVTERFTWLLLDSNCYPIEANLNRTELQDDHSTMMFQQNWPPPVSLHWKLSKLKIDGSEVLKGSPRLSSRELKIERIVSIWDSQNIERLVEGRSSWRRVD